MNHPRRTHIDTLADNTPKARRRVRSTLGLNSAGFILDIEVREAQQLARFNERREAEKVAAARKAHASSV